MDDIIPEDAAMGAQAVVGGAVQPKAVELDEDDATTLVVPPSLPAIDPSIIDPTQKLIVNAIASTTAAINSFSVAQLPLAHPLTSPLPHFSPQSSNNLKCPLSSLSPNETDTSLLFSPMGPPVSTPSMSSIAVVTPHGTKCSCTSTSQSVGGSAAGRAVQKNMTGKNTTSIALQQVDSSIRHLGNSITRSFVDPLNVLREVTHLLTALGDRLPAEHRMFVLVHFADTSRAGAAMILLSLGDNEYCLQYIAALYDAHRPVYS